MIFRQLDILGQPKPEVDYFSISFGQVFLGITKTFAVLAMFASVWVKVRILRLLLCKVSLW